MEKQQKKEWYKISFIIIMGLLIVSIPLEMVFSDIVLLNISKVFQKSIAIFVISYMIIRDDLFIHERAKLTWRDLHYIPLVILAFSNIFAGLILGKFSINELAFEDVLINAILILLQVIVEELLFRYLLLNNFLKQTTHTKAIIYSSLIFGAMHLLNINSLGSIPYVLLQVLYTSFLGLVIGTVYVQDRNIHYAIIYHFIFNFINGYLSTHLFTFNWDYKFYILSFLIGLVVFIYLVFIVKYYKRKDDLSASKNMDL